MEGVAGSGVDDNYRIDTSRVFLAGESAGALCVMGAVLYNQHIMDELLPAVSPGVSLSTACGSIDAHYYDDGGNYDMSYYLGHIKGLLVKSAGLYVPYSFASNPRSFFEVTPFLPTIFFHGQNDATFDIDNSNLNFSSTSAYNFTSYCTDATNGSTFKLNSTTSPNVLECGSKYIWSNFLRDPSYTLIPSELYIDCQSGHNLDLNGTVPYLTEFGTGVSSRDDVVQYIVSRAAIFFGNIINGTAGSPTKLKFVECKNTRVKCNTDNSVGNTCCSYCTDDPPDTNKCNDNQNQLP